MAELIAQFEEAVRNVEPSDDDKRNASDAHQEVRDCLSADSDLNAWGIETVIIGSYKRHVSIRRVKDVDVLVNTGGPAHPDFAPWPPTGDTGCRRALSDLSDASELIVFLRSVDFS